MAPELAYPAVVFDFDGTLADTLEGIVLGLSQTFAEVDLEPPRQEQVALTIGVPLLQIIERLLPVNRRDPALIGRLAARYRAIQRPLLPRLLRSFPGVHELLAALRERGVRLAVASNKIREDLLLHIELLRLTGLFETLVAGDDHPPELRKPHPTPLLELLLRFQLTGDRLLMVGDTIYDVQMANAAGCHSAAVTYGCHPRALLAAAQPTYLVDRPEELIAIITGVAPPRLPEA